MTNDVCSQIVKENNDYYTNTVILTSHNECTYFSNRKILKLMKGEVTYFCIDYATHKGVDRTDDNTQINFSSKFFNNIREDLPSH